MRFWTVLICACFFSISVLSQGFLPQTDDIPQMDGLVQMEEIANFDSPAERLLILTAYSAKTPKEVARFYQQTLKNLGWKEIKANAYQRQNDFFQIELSKEKGRTFVQMTLTQKNTLN